jgi:hypothetical protein
VLADLEPRRVIVSGTDADLAAVLVRLLRRERLDVEVAYLPRGKSVVAQVWGLPRDAVGLAADTFLLDPTNYIPFKNHLWWSAGREYFTLLDLKGQTYQTIQGIQRSSVDYYASLRSLYRQFRASQIRKFRVPKPRVTRGATV